MYNEMIAVEFLHAAVSKLFGLFSEGPTTCHQRMRDDD